MMTVFVIFLSVEFLRPDLGFVQQLHDFTNHLRAINGMLPEGNAAKEYVQKLLHDLDVKSIRETVSRYDGRFEYRYENGVFTSLAVLQS